MYRLLSSLALLLLTVSCKIAPQPIAYGTDACHFCHMTIVDRQHASELVTAKGKAFKFDAVECMVFHLQDVTLEEGALTLVTDFNRPGTLIGAENASFLVSENLPSPMGAFLTAFASEAEGQEARQAYGGVLYDWDGIQKKLNP